MPGESAGINRAAIDDAAAHVDCHDLVKRWRDSRVLCIGRANTPKLAADSSSAPNKKVTVSSYVKRTPLRRVRNVNRNLPGGSPSVDRLNPVKSNPQAADSVQN